MIFVYPEEMLPFVEERLEVMGNIQLAKEVNEEFNLAVSSANISSYLIIRELKRSNEALEKFKGFGKSIRPTREELKEKFKNDNIYMDKVKSEIRDRRPLSNCMFCQTSTVPGEDLCDDCKYAYEDYLSVGG